MSNYSLYVYLLVIIGIVLAVLVFVTQADRQDTELRAMRDDSVIKLQSSPSNGIELLFISGLMIGIFTYGLVQVRRNIEE